MTTLECSSTVAGISEDKNRLQEYLQKASMSLPVYQTFIQGEPHAPRFSSQVWVDDTCFVSPNAFLSKKMAEQDAAKHALIGIIEKVKNEIPQRLQEDTVFCKSILNEYAVKMNMKPPIYTTEEAGTFIPMFISTVVFNDATYVGPQGKNKKEASQLAARSAILSILGSESSSTMSVIVRSKFTLYDRLNGVKNLLVAPHNDTIPTEIKLVEEVKDISGNEQNQVRFWAPHNDTTPTEIKLGEEVKDLSGNEQNQVHFQGDSEVPLSGPLDSVGPKEDVQNTLPESIVRGPSDIALQSGHLHVFKKPKTGESSTSEFAPPIVFQAPISSAPVAPYIEFVPQTSEQGPACMTTGKKRNRKKRKAENNKQNQAVLAAVAVPQDSSLNCFAPQ